DPLAPHLSTIISSNHFRSAIGDFAPTTFLLLPSNQPCSITGNVMINTNPYRLRNGPSLWIVAGLGMQGTEQLSVSGNVFNGGTALAQLQRSPEPTNIGWQSFNADPS